MQWRNSSRNYGWPAILFHWVVALTVAGLFGLGLWMVDLSYMHPYYNSSVDLHRSVGVLLFLVVTARLIWRLVDPPPQPLGKPWERRLARMVHWVMYGLLFATMIAGYLITTADGSSIKVFDWFEVPATLTGRNQEDLAGDVHEVLAWTLIVLAALHAAAAFKHALVDRDGTLRRMLYPS